MSSPSEPVDTVSTSIDLSFLPSRMIEPLLKLRSIWESAASRAFDLSMEEPSTRRSAAVAIAPTPYDRDSKKKATTNSIKPPYTICSQFAICSHPKILRQLRRPTHLGKVARGRSPRPEESQNRQWPQHNPDPL